MVAELAIKPETDLSLPSLVSHYKQAFNLLPEVRGGSNTQYRVSDAAIGAFTAFFMQQPSFLAHQRVLNQRHGRSNASTLFGMVDIPSDNQIRNILDKITPGNLTPLFDELRAGLIQNGHLDKYIGINDTMLIALDGTHYFSSNQLHCRQCSTRQHKNGSITYSHSAITPVIVKPGDSTVISLPPEFITPQDGHDKQDSEQAASKRWLAQQGQKYRSMAGSKGATILGDDLYAHQPLCESILAQKMNFILTCKEDSHKTLYEYVHELDSMNKVQTLQVVRKKGKKKWHDTYRFLEKLPICDGESALEVNWCELISTNEAGKVVSKFAYISNFAITAENVIQMVASGRARWHIENGNNNILKTKGYHLEHNFGHGKKHLASLLLTLNLLAFLFHTILQFNDQCYSAIRLELPTRKMFFQHLQALTTYMIFNTWHELMCFMMEGLELPIPP